VTNVDLDLNLNLNATLDLVVDEIAAKSVGPSGAR
jgi:hypothetical protein